MAEGFSFLLSEGANRPRRPKRNQGPLIAGGIAVAIVIVLAVVLLSGDSSENGNATGMPVPLSVDNGTDPVTPSDPVETPVAPLTPKISIDVYGDGTRLAGVAMLQKGDIDGAEEWLTNYLNSPSEGRDDQALFALTMIHKTRGRAAEAEDLLRRLIRLRSDSLYAGDGLYELAILLEKSGRMSEVHTHLLEAVRVYPRSRGGRLAARKLADDLYDQHVTEKKRRTEWERIRDLYSIALPGIEDETDRKSVVNRLDELNQWVIFTAYARSRKGYPTNIVFHTVKRGETIGLIAKRYAVTQGSIRRLNGIQPESNIIRPSEELKILRGRTEIHVDMNTLNMTVWINGSFFREYLVGIGREGRTPPGNFTIASRLIDPDWWQNGEAIPFGDPRNILGTRWLGFEKKGPGRGIGIHGTTLKDNVWQGIGERKSNGCVRMRNPDVEELYDFVPLGTKVIIIE